MYKLSKRSTINLSQTHTDLQILFHEVIKERDIAVICGHRGEKEQNEAYEKNFSKLKFPLSKHNKLPSLAVDVVPYPIDWTNIDRFEELGEFVLMKAKELKEAGKIKSNITWGGNWKKFTDYPHYEIS